MKIILISASPHKEKSHTLFLANELLKGCKSKNKDIITETVHLRDMKIEFCIHCEMCHIKCLECPIKDDVRKIQDKMLSADGIILASPNYINCVTGAMKTFFDRSSHFIHCARLLDKYVVGVVTSGSGHDTPVLNYMKHFALICGAQFAGRVSSAAMDYQEKKAQAFKLGKKLIMYIEKRKKFPAQIKTIEKHKNYFKQLLEMRKNEWVGEYNYWLEKEGF